jgi:hypothetical protein
MRVKQLLNEGLSDEAHDMERDHEVQMARAQLYNAAKDAIRLHKMLQHISEQQGLEGWVQSKITLAADYLKSVANYLEYEQVDPSESAIAPIKPIVMPEDASGGATGAGAVAAVAAPIGKKMIKRRVK